MALVLTNNATSTLAANINTAVTSVTVAAGDAGKFPAVTAGNWFPLTIEDALGNMEIVKVTARSGATMTVQRAQEGTTAKAFTAGARVDLRLTTAAVSAVDFPSAAAKATPVDADSVALVDSAASSAPKLLLWSALKTALKAYFDSIYQAVGSYVPTTRSLSAGTGLLGGGNLSADRSFAVSYGTTAGTAAQGNDSRLSDAREWTAATVSQTDAEAGTATDRRAWTSERVRQNAAAVDIGVGQTWADVTASRSAGTTYQNTTGKPIFAMIGCGSGAPGGVQVSADGTTWIDAGNARASGTGIPTALIVPDTWRYRAISGTEITRWSELR